MKSNLKRLRKEAGLTMNKLAKMTGSNKTIKWTYGEIRV